MLRRLEILLVGAVLLVGAFATGVDFLFFLVYLVLIVVGGAYLLSRFGLADLEAGYALDRTHGHVGEQLRATYTLRNVSRLPKLWLESSSPSTLPVPLPGRALSLGPRAERSWAARVPLVARGHYRVDPLLIRTGDPLGLFEAAATVGAATAVTVYPRVEPLPDWRLPPSSLEGSRSSPERTLQATPLVTSIRPYLPGDAYNRIHWKSTARQSELQVKEFDLEQTADLWLFLDLQAKVQTGRGDESTLEAGVRTAAALASHALVDNRAVGITVSGHRTSVVPADRGARQHLKIMSLLAAVAADGTEPFVETLVQGLPRLRRGMTAIVITPSLERDWVRPLASLRGRGIRAAACLVDAAAYAAYHATGPQVVVGDADGKAARALQHALAEHDIRVYHVKPARPLGEILVSARGAGLAVAR